eukprot:9137046-Prorocentrum_lima.AAC.1
MQSGTGVVRAATRIPPAVTCWTKIEPENTGFSGGGKPTRDPFAANADYDEDVVSRIEDAIENEMP